jgi:hypothetical protein
MLLEVEPILIPVSSINCSLPLLMKTPSSFIGLMILHLSLSSSVSVHSLRVTL